ncbi:MAG: CHAT domain-containing protein, partial [Oscillochloris sp.]|nr:CHAT domain-containing protein [Oscillochloris sp.]
LMDQLYQSLSNGASKAAALRAAQRALLAQHPNLHPAFWGGFQLVGDPQPLSTTITPGSTYVTCKIEQEGAANLLRAGRRDISS